MGCYYRGKRHGLGIYRYKNGNGARYGGDWNLGVKAGWGTMYFPDGAQYTGTSHLCDIFNVNNPSNFKRLFGHEHTFAFK
jgi:hypothetical protein